MTLSPKIISKGSILFLASALMISGCKSAPPAGSSSTTSSPAVTPASPAAPAGSSTALNAPANPPTATQPVPVARVIPRGTRVAVSLSQTLSASRNNEGDGFSGVLAAPIKTTDGIVIFARGTKVTGTVVAAKGRGRFKGAGDLGIELTSIDGRNISTTEYEKSRSGKGKRTAGFIGGGTGVGAIIGGLAGGGKGALIGGLAGAGAGTAASAYTGNKDVVIPAETVITFRLTAPLRM